MHSVINRHEWRVVGMSRSGNHAIINWLLAQTEGRTCFINCTEPKKNPYAFPRPLDSGLPYVANYSDFDLDREQRGEFSSKDYLIYSYEDCFLGMLGGDDAGQQHDVWVGPSEKRRDILILRDPFNLFASRMKCDIGHIGWHTAVRMWKQHARQFLGRKKYLLHDLVCISYNAWVRQKSYRRGVAKTLGLKFTDAQANAVAETAGGSSFDGLKFRRRASRMKVFDRWKDYAASDTFRQLFDQEILDLSQAIFGEIPAVEAFSSDRSLQH